jgi:hypothetical protein
MARLLPLLVLLAAAGCRTPGAGTGGAACAESHVSPGWGRPDGAGLEAECVRAVPAAAPPERPAPRAGAPGWDR